MTSTNDYNGAKNWNQKFTKTVDIMRLTKHSHPTWRPMFDEMEKDLEFEPVIQKINNVLTTYKNTKKNNIIPYPKFVFNAFNLTPLDSLKVVFIGLEPSQAFATGLAFSHTYGNARPISVNNIIKSLEYYNHINLSADNSNLSKWTKRGCLLLNLELTSYEFATHGIMWKKFTDKIISYISNNCEHVVFVLWGLKAIEKTILIDESKHFIVKSSHPSGLSYNKEIYTSTISVPAFDMQDHFGLINNFIISNGGNAIDWRL
jgi:uracil-DNA glycosylase